MLFDLAMIALMAAWLLFFLLGGVIVLLLGVYLLFTLLRAERF
jgi:K+-transporting ATPase KdpF subunit